LIDCPAAGPAVAREVGVPREVRSLIRGRVVEQLDVRALPAAHHRDLVDHRPRVDVEQVLHERARVVEERPEAQRRDAAHHVLEPVDRLPDVRDGDADVVHPDEAELAVRVAGRTGARARRRGRGRRESGSRSGGDDRERQERARSASPRASLPDRHGRT
jgi:hypothetical protein